MTDLESKAEAVEELSEPMTIGVEAYISEDYARAERDKLWRKVWQQVGRVEGIHVVGAAPPATLTSPYRSPSVWRT